MAESGVQCNVPFPVGEVVKQGYLFVKRPPRRCWEKLRAWHKRYFVLRDETQDRSSHIEMYEGKGCVTVSALENSKPKMTLHLDQCVHIGYTTESSKFPYAMVLVCQGKSPILLAADDELGIRSWLLALSLITHKGCGNSISECLDTTTNPSNHVNENKTPIDFSDKSCSAWQPCGPVGEGKATTCRLGDPFQVSVQQTEASQKSGLSGDLRLVVCRHGVGLTKSREAECFLLWPVGYIRQFCHQTLSGSGWSRSTVVTLEVGRRCSTGEGIFQFRTNKGREIIRELKKMVELWSARKTSDVRRHSRQEESPTIGNKSGHSAPCTPSISLPQIWQKGTSNGQVLTSSTEQKDDLNYIVPTIERSPITSQRKLSCDVIKGRLLHPPSPHEPFSLFGRSLPATPERLSLNESDCIQILSEDDMETKLTDKKINSKSEDDEGYIEVLPAELQNKEGSDP